MHHFKGVMYHHFMSATNGGIYVWRLLVLCMFGLPFAVLMSAFGFLLISAAQKVSSIHYALHAALLTAPSFRLQNLLTCPLWSLSLIVITIRQQQGTRAHPCAQHVLSVSCVQGILSAAQDGAE